MSKATRPARCEAEPQIDYLKDSDQGPQAYEDAKDQRNCRQQFEEVDDRREQVEVRQDDVVDEVGLKRNSRRFAHYQSAFDQYDRRARLGRA